MPPKTRKVHSELQRMKATIDLSADLNSEVLAHWGRYCCVLAAGFIENSISTIYSEYVRACGNPKVGGYAAARLRTIQNPKARRFKEVASSFSKQWGHQLEAFMEEDGRGDAIDGIMANRHLIAHGKSSGITVGRLREWLKKSVQVLIFIEHQLGL